MTYSTSPKRRALLAAVVAAALLTAGVWPASGEPAEKVVSACDAAGGGAWTHYTQAQTFQPPSEIVRAEAQLMFFETFEAPITARIVVRPAMTVDGFGAPGITVARMVTEVKAAPYQTRWVAFSLAQPLATSITPETSTEMDIYSLEIDFPVDQFPGPPKLPVSWMNCRGASDGRAYVVVGASQIGRIVADGGGPEPVLADGTLAAVPATGAYQAHPAFENFQYRIIGR